MLLAGLIVYVLIQFAIGVWVSRQIRSEKDYILAGRTLGPALVTFPVFATWFGSEAIIATTGSVYEDGLSGALVDPLAYGSAVVVSGAVFAAVLWRNGLTTFADLFRQRYSPAVEKLVVAILLPGSLFWAAAQIRAFGQVLSASSGFDLAAAITIAAVLVGAYTVIGGLLADAVTDFLQGIVVIVGLLILAIVVAGAAGGVGAVVAATEPERLRLLGGEESALRKLEHVVVVICGSIVAVELISRFLGARSDRIAQLGTVSGGAMYLVVGLIPIFLGLAAAVLVDKNPALKAAIADPEQAAAALAAHYLPGWTYAIFAGALVSAILSNVHSTIHAPAAQVSHNVVVKLIPGLDERSRLLSVRMTALALSIVAFGMALSSERLKDLVENASAFGSAGVFVTACFALFTRIGGAPSALAAILTGGIVWALGRFALDWAAPYITALILATIAYLGVDWWQKREGARAAG